MKKRCKKINIVKFSTSKPELMKEVLIRNKERLIKLWDRYNDHDKELYYSDIYKVRVAREHRKKLVELFLPLNEEESSCLDIGCGPGTLFEEIKDGLKCKYLHALDWSPKMLKDARKKGRRLQEESGGDFNFHLVNYDASEGLPWRNNTFNCTVSNLFICYVPGGWEDPIWEQVRVTKEGGVVYIGTLLKNWSFTGVLWKHFLPEFIKEPRISLGGLKYRKIISEISKVLKEEEGAEFPSKEELLEFIKYLGLKDIEVIPTYWGGGLVLKARKALS